MVELARTCLRFNASRCSIQRCDFAHEIPSLRTMELASNILSESDHALLVPILKNAGQDISHWFDGKSGDVRVHPIHPFCALTLLNAHKPPEI